MKQVIGFDGRLTDIAGGSDESKPINVKVDDTFPVINSIDYNVSGKYVNFIVNITYYQKIK